jgi:hypothetical protein
MDCVIESTAVIRELQFGRHRLDAQHRIALRIVRRIDRENVFHVPCRVPRYHNSCFAAAHRRFDARRI